MHTNFASLDPKKYILIKGAAEHNLKNIDVAIPRNQLVVITGLSGSGKSSLAFDTLYAEGQRRYVESLSAYARQFLGKHHKPKVQYIKGISPAIAVEQKVNTSNPRSTVGTSTEIYDYLKLLFSRIGKTYSPISGEEVKKERVADVLEYVKSFDAHEKLLLLAPITVPEGRTIQNTLDILKQQGYARIKIQDRVVRIDEANPIGDENLNLVVDRIVKKNDEGFFNRLADAVETAFYEGAGSCSIEQLHTQKIRTFSNRFELDGMQFIAPSLHLFSFNNPYGACPKCEGYGDLIAINPDLVIPDTSLSIFEDAVSPWRGENSSIFKEEFIKHAHRFDFPIHKPFFELSDAQKALVWNGNAFFQGIHSFFEQVASKTYKIQNRVLLSRYRDKTTCPHCNGTRLRPEASYVKIANTAITELVEMPVDELLAFFKKLSLTDYEYQIAKRVRKEIETRLEFLNQLGLGYLTLNRKSNTLSGGESQRINLATSLGSSLVGSLYILDEPSIGLHPKDTERLIGVLTALRNLGNTVVVVEHDEAIMKSADTIIDIGPEAGALGGELVATGTYAELLTYNTLTAQYLNGLSSIEIPKRRAITAHCITVIGARANNLKNIDITIPLGLLTVVTGVSGSGKSTLVKKIIYPAIRKKLGESSQKPAEFSKLQCNMERLQKIEFIDQNPIGRSSRSNPVTYGKAYDDIRKLFGEQRVSKIRNYAPKHFSFNVDGGRCEACKGEGQITIEMQFMADVHLTCEHCNGKRFKKEILEVKFEGKDIDQILHMTVDEAIDFFAKHNQSRIRAKLQPLQDVGLGYVQLGQSSATLSGGEAQRIKLASFLAKGNTKNKTLFVFDEPTTGLHTHDIKKLLRSFDALLANGHSIIVVEHNLDLIKCADYIIDLGLEGGKKGGNLIAQGTPEEICKISDSYTGMFLKEKMYPQQNAV